MKVMEKEFNKYGVSTAFEKILAHNVPGVIFIFILLMFLDVISGKRILAQVASLDFKILALLVIVIIYFGFFVGLIIDELHHVLLEEKIYIPWAKKRGKEIEFIDLDGKACTESYYIPFIGLDLYKYNLKNFYSYSEFDANISLVLLPASVITPIFISHYLMIEALVAWLIGIILLIIAIGMFYAGFTAFCDYYSALKNTIRGVLKTNES
jgi:hypothetical protein